MSTRETEGLDVKEILRRELPRLRAEFGVKRIGLFGSFARGRQKKESDIDLLIHQYFGTNYEIVWTIISRDLPELRAALKPIIAELQKKTKHQECEHVR